MRRPRSSSVVRAWRHPMSSVRSASVDQPGSGRHFECVVDLKAPGWSRVAWWTAPGWRRSRTLPRTTSRTCSSKTTRCPNRRPTAPTDLCHRSTWPGTGRNSITAPRAPADSSPPPPLFRHHAAPGARRRPQPPHQGHPGGREADRGGGQDPRLVARGLPHRGNRKPCPHVGAANDADRGSALPSGHRSPEGEVMTLLETPCSRRPQTCSCWFPTHSPR